MIVRQIFRTLSSQATGRTMEFQSIAYESKSKVATITLNRPAVYNAIDLYMPAEIEQAVKLANEDDEVKAIVITGHCLKSMIFLW